MDYLKKVFITLFLSPKRYNLLNDIINYTFSGVFSFFIRIFVSTSFCSIEKDFEPVHFCLFRIDSTSL